MGYRNYIKAKKKYVDWCLMDDLTPSMKVEQRRYQRHVDKQLWKRFVESELYYLDTELWRAQRFDEDLLLDFGYEWLYERND